MSKLDVGIFEACEEHTCAHAEALAVFGRHGRQFVHASLAVERGRGHFAQWLAKEPGSVSAARRTAMGLWV